MNILYLVHRVPFPPDKGDKIRSFRELEYLARRHRVWCACFVDAASDVQFVDPLRAYCQDVAAIRLNRASATLRGLAGLLCGRTVTESFYTHAAMRAALQAWCTSVKFDAVVAFSSSMASYALQVPADRRVLDLCDLDSQKWLDYARASRGPLRWLYRAEGHRLALKERAWSNAFDAIVLVTEAEASALAGSVTPGKLHVVGNGVLKHVEGRRSKVEGLGGALSIDIRPLTFDLRHSPTVGFIGVMDYRPNVDAVCWFVSNCLRSIREACPGTVFRIVGRSPARRVRRLASVSGVEVVGAVEDVAAEVGRFDVSVAPMRIARGLQNKVLEAMAAAKPVVLTSKAAEGIAGRNEQVYLVADQPDQIVERVVRLLRDPAERERLARAARRFVAVNHCWEEVLRKFELIVTGVMARNADHVALREDKLSAPAEDLVVSAVM